MWYNLAVLIVVVHASIGVRELPFEPYVNALLGTCLILMYGTWSLWLNWYRPKFSNEFVSSLNMIALAVSLMLMFAQPKGEISWFVATWAFGFLVAMMLYPGKFVYVPINPRPENPIAGMECKGKDA